MAVRTCPDESADATSAPVNVSTSIVPVDPVSISCTVNALLWEHACGSSDPSVEAWPLAAGEQVLRAVLNWTRNGTANSLESAVAREKQLVDAGHVWSRSHSSPTVMLDRLTKLPGVLLLADQPRQLHWEQSIRCVTAAAAYDTFQQLQARALLDPLTETGNRRALHFSLDQALARARRYEQDLSVVSVDLDGLKQINDELGHPAGDSALISLVKILKAVLREEDEIFRVGGDEFVLLLHDTEPESAPAVMERVEEMGAPAFSWGVAGYPADGSEAVTLLHTSDRDLYARRQFARSPVATRRTERQRTDRGRRSPWPSRRLHLVSVVTTTLLLRRAIGPHVGSTPVEIGERAPWPRQSRMANARRTWG